MDTSLALSAGTLSSFTMEIIKWIIRSIKKDHEFDFPPLFYELGLPFLTALWGIGLFYIGIGEGQLMEWKKLVEWFVSIVISLATYYIVNKPYKTYVRTYNINKG